MSNESNNKPRNQNITYYRGNSKEKLEKFSEGPWVSEPDMATWNFQLPDWEVIYPCEILRNEDYGIWCGYVIVQISHPLYQVNYMDVHNISVHGGLTYSELTEDYGWRFGFDCGHAGDYTPKLQQMDEFYKLYEMFTAVNRTLDALGPSQETYRNIDYAIAETNHLAEQLAILHKEAFIAEESENEND